MPATGLAQQKLLALVGASVHPAGSVSRLHTHEGSNGGLVRAVTALATEVGCGKQAVSKQQAAERASSRACKQLLQ